MTHRIGRFLIGGLATLLFLASCNQSQPIGSPDTSPNAPLPLAPAALAFINITEGQTLSGYPQSPGVTIQNGTATRVQISFRKADGTGGWDNTLSSAPACLIGICTTWDTTKLANGSYYMQVTATLTGGAQLTGRVNFKIANGVTAPPPPPPSSTPSLAFINVTEGQSLSGYPQSPGVTVQNGTATRVVVSFRKSDGTGGWDNTLSSTPACLIGVCTTWNTFAVPNGDYYLQATVTLSGGQQLTGKVNFKIANGVTSPPPSPSPTPPPPPTPTPPPPPSPTPPPPPPPSGTRAAWNNVASWGIQYQGFNASSVNALDAVNIDVSVVGRFDGTGKEWQYADISRLTKKKWMFSYLAVGQAQNIETYWQSWWTVGNPSWLISTSEYGGTYNVAYWDAAWQAIMFQTIDRIINNGFDGLFLDQSDPYWNNSFPKGSTPISTFSQRSKDLVCNIANYARGKKASFKIFVNGGANQYDSFGSGYADCLDATAGEHLWFLGTGRPDTSGYPPYTIPVLQRLAGAGKKIFTFDYTSNQGEINSVLSNSRSKGFIPTITDGSISTTPKVF